MGSASSNLGGPVLERDPVVGGRHIQLLDDFSQRGLALKAKVFQNISDVLGLLEYRPGQWPTLDEKVG
jgi:hypothetical protein